MKFNKTLTLLLFLISLSFITTPTKAIVISPPSPVTGCLYTISELVYYDVCLSEVTDATVFYNISEGTANPSNVIYPPVQTMTYYGNANYSKQLTAPWSSGTYTASLNITKSGYSNIYDSKIFTVMEDAPSFRTHSYTAFVNYFNIFWDAAYQNSCSPNRDLSVMCYLNDKYNNPSKPYPYTRMPGEGMSTIEDPQYYFGKLATGNPNNISCKIYDTSRDRIYSWSNESFYPIAFSTAVTPLTVTLGKSFNLPIYVQNLGLLSDNYTVQIKSYQSGAVSIEFAGGTLGPLKTNETSKTTARLKVLSTSATTLNITVISSTSGISVSRDIPIRSGMASLSEFDWIGIIQILFLVLIVLACGRKISKFG
jgi:hypothetical protein